MGNTLANFDTNNNDQVDDSDGIISKEAKGGDVVVDPSTTTSNNKKKKNNNNMHTNMMMRITTKYRHPAIMRMMKDDVFKKYEVLGVLGSGGMGLVAKVRIRPGFSTTTTTKGSSPLKTIGNGITQKVINPINNGITKNVINPITIKLNKKERKDIIIDDTTNKTTTTSRSNSSDINTDYDEDKDNACTSTSTSSNQTREVYYALKSIKKEVNNNNNNNKKDIDNCDFINQQLDGLRNEIDILSNLDHPNIARAYEVFENKHQIYMVLELCEGGDLYSRAPYSETESNSVVRQLLSAINYMHARGVVHRDLKFQNIMWEHDGPDAQIKLIDFGLSKKFGHIDDKEWIMSSGVGSISTMAPEVLNVLIEGEGSYTSHADLWSCGVITYTLLSSKRPFEGKNLAEIVRNICSANYVLDDVSGPWCQISENAKDLVRNLLVKDPQERLDASQALKHDWFVHDESDELPPDQSRQLPRLEREVKQRLEAYKNVSKLKKIALNVIAYRSTNKEILELRKVFNHFDKDKDGIIKLNEFREAITMSSSRIISDEDIDEIFHSIDINCGGDIQYREFLGAALHGHSIIEEERIAEAFDQLDSDKSGYISKANLIRFLGEDAAALDVEQLFDEFETKKDGQVSYKEFKQMFNQKVRSTKILVHGE